MLMWLSGELEPLPPRNTGILTQNSALKGSRLEANPNLVWLDLLFGLTLAKGRARRIHSRNSAQVKNSQVRNRLSDVVLHTPSEKPDVGMTANQEWQCLAEFLHLIKRQGRSNLVPHGLDKGIGSQLLPAWPPNQEQYDHL